MRADTSESAEPSPPDEHLGENAATKRDGKGGARKPAGETGGGGAKPAARRSRKPKRAEPEPSAPEAWATEPSASTEPAVDVQRVVVTGASGFVGGAVARLLRMRGRDVIAPVRDRRRTGDLADYGVTVVDDDLSEPRVLAELLRDVDGVVHAAGSYRVGIAREDRGGMWDANIGTTTRVLDAAELARTPRIVYVSTCGYFGNTRGRVVDETHRRDVREGFLSWYDETKFGAHEVARQRIAAGAPVVIVMPSQVYGPGDPSQVGAQLRAAHDGRLRYRVLDDVGFGWVHVDDLATGIIAALERGTPGESYVLSGPRHRLGEALATAAALGGRRPPRVAIPTGLLSVAAAVGGRIGRPGLREVIESGAGVTYWASAEKAERELEFNPRSLEDGLRDTFNPPVV